MFDQLLGYWEDRSFLREVVEDNPIKGAIIFIILQALQVIIAPLPGEVTGFMAGFLFGSFLGFLLSTIGIFIGSAIAFLLMRAFRKHFLFRYERHPFYLRVKKLFKKHGYYGVFLLYLFPGFPKDILNYLMAFMPMSLKSFLTISTLGRAPGTFALSIQGDVVYGGHPYKIFIVSFAFVIVFLIFILLKKKFEKVIFEE